MNPNYYAKQNERGLKRKLELIEYKGGKCEKCGYDKNISALDFHHINPEDKEFQLDVRHLSNTSIERLKTEVDKCMLLCANCHRELHNPTYDKDNIQNLLNEFTTKSLKFLKPNRRQSICPVCGKSFDYFKTKYYCSKECREADKHYPSKDEVIKTYEELKSWQKVADFYDKYGEKTHDFNRGMNPRLQIYDF